MMKSATPYARIAGLTYGLIAVGALCIGLAAQAQDADRGYTIREDAFQGAQIGRGNPDDGPVRLARFSTIQGNVTWRPDDTAEWSPATVNLPIRQGAQIWITGGGRAEVQFDDGSLLRLGNNSVATLQTLYSDSEGEFTEIKLTDGLVSLRLKHELSVFQVDTPLASVKAIGPASIRIGADDGVEVGVRAGAVTVEGAQGTVKMQRGDYLDLANDNSPFDLRALPREDSWEGWNDERDDRLAAGANDSREHQLPSNIALVATDLDTYGDWRNEPQYGWVWCPRVTVAEWRPYCYGHWTWVNPFGWTWVSDEPWGWAPYHYGTWTHLSYGWAWVPGPVTQCWSPAVVNFTECDNRVAWCPLAPAEIRYTAAVGFGFRHGNAAFYFSIGQAAVYYPSSAGYCEPRIFSTTVINHDTFVRGGADVHTGPSAFSRFRSTSEYFAANSNTYLNARFVPVNSRTAPGVTAVGAADFGGRGRYEPMGPGAAGLFQRGRVVAAPPAGRAPLAGPVSVAPTALALTPTRNYLPNTRMPSNTGAKPVFRTPLQPSIERSSAPVRTVPGSPAAGRTPGDRTSFGSGRPDTTGGQQDGRRRLGLPDDGPARRTGSGLGSGPMADGSGVLTPAQIRAREARRALGVGGAPAAPGRTPPDAGSRSEYPFGRVRTPDTSRTGDTGRGAEPRRDPVLPVPESRRSDPASSRGRTGTPDTSRSPEPRRYPTPPTVEPRRDPTPRQPEPPRTAEPRRDPAPARQDFPRGAEPRRDPAPARQDPPRGAEPRRDPAPQPEPRRSPPADPPRRDREPPAKEKEKDSGSGSGGTPTTGRSRR